MTEQRVRAGARVHRKQQRHIVRCIDIEGNAWEVHHDRLEAFLAEKPVVTTRIFNSGKGVRVPRVQLNVKGFRCSRLPAA